MKKNIIKTIPRVIPARTFEVYDSIFKQRVHVLLNHKPEDYAKFLTKIKAVDTSIKAFDSFAGFSSSIDIDGKPSEYMIWLRDFQWTIKSQGTLIHEITHTVIKIFLANNIPFVPETQEFIAHQIANMYEDIAEKLLVIAKSTDRKAPR